MLELKHFKQLCLLFVFKCVVIILEESLTGHYGADIMSLVHLKCPDNDGGIFKKQSSIVVYSADHINTPRSVTPT